MMSWKMASYGLTGARAQRLRALTGAYGALRALTGALRALTGALRAQLLRAQLFTGLRAHLTGASLNVKYTVLFLRALTGAVFRGFFTGALYGLTGAPYGRLRAQKCTLRALTGAYGRLWALTGAYGRKFLTGLRVHLRTHLPGDRLCHTVTRYCQFWLVLGDRWQTW